MEITKVRIHKVNKGNNNVIGYATITIDDCFAVNNIRIIDNNGKIICAMPNRIVGDKRKDYAHPVNQETRDMIQEKIMEEYNKPTEE